MKQTAGYAGRLPDWTLSKNLEHSGGNRRFIPGVICFFTTHTFHMDIGFRCTCIWLHLCLKICAWNHLTFFFPLSFLTQTKKSPFMLLSTHCLGSDWQS